MPISEDVQRELSRLFVETAENGTSFVDVSGRSLLSCVERWGEDSDAEALSRRLAICESVLVSCVDLTFGDQVLADGTEQLVIRFALPRQWRSAAAA